MGPGYLSGAVAICGQIILMIVCDVVHLPAVSVLSFALRAGPESNLLSFGLAVTVTALLILLERIIVWVWAH